jgi:hypothetical protein
MIIAAIPVYAGGAPLFTKFKNRFQILLVSTAFLGLSLGLVGCGSASSSANADQSKDPPRDLLAGLFSSTEKISVPEGTGIAVVLDDAVSSARNRSGDTFDATVVEPVAVDGKIVIPKDARAKGRVVDAKPSGHLHSPARLELALDSVEVDGNWYDIDTAGNTRRGRNHNKHNLVFIGGSTAGGMLIGGLAGGGVGAVIGGLVGAGGGTAAAAATGKRDVSLPAETHLTFRLAQPVEITVKKKS